MKMFLENATGAPVKTPGPSGEQPGVALRLQSGGLSVDVLFPANQAQAVCEVIMEAAVASMEKEAGVILPAKLTPEDIKRMAADADRLRGDGPKS